MAINYRNIAGEESATVTFRVATVEIARGSTNEQQELLTLADPQSSLGLARVLAIAPTSTEYGLGVRIISGPSSAADLPVQISGNSTVVQGTSPWVVSGTVRATLSSTAAENPVQISGNSTSVISGNVTVIQGTATNLKAQAENYQGGTAVGAANPLQVSLANTGSNGTAVRVTTVGNVSVTGSVSASLFAYFHMTASIGSPGDTCTVTYLLNGTQVATNPSQAWPEGGQVISLSAYGADRITITANTPLNGIVPLYVLINGRGLFKQFAVPGDSLSFNVAEAGALALALRTATPVNLSDSDGELEALQISEGALWTKESRYVEQGAEADDVTGPLMQGRVEDTAPAYTPATVGPLSLTTDGRLRVVTLEESYNLSGWGSPYAYGGDGQHIEQAYSAW